MRGNPYARGGSDPMKTRSERRKEKQRRLSKTGRVIRLKKRLGRITAKKFAYEEDSHMTALMQSYIVRRKAERKAEREKEGKAPDAEDEEDISMGSGSDMEEEDEESGSDFELGSDVDSAFELDDAEDDDEEDDRGFAGDRKKGKKYNAKDTRDKGGRQWQAKKSPRQPAATAKGGKWDNKKKGGQQGGNSGRKNAFNNYVPRGNAQQQRKNVQSSKRVQTRSLY